MSKIAMVIDTNVFIGAGFRPNGYSAKMIEKVREGEWRLIWHGKTRRETERIARKIPVFSDRFLEDLFREEDEFSGRIIEDDFDFIVDREDRKFAALAVAAEVPLISNDIHLLAWEERLPVPVQTAAAFFMRIYG